MNHFIKAVALILAIGMITAFATSCGTSDKKSINDSSTAAEIKVPTISEQKCFEHDGVIVTAKSITNDSIYGIGIKMEVQNNSAKNIMLSCDEVIVNNCMLTDLFTSDVASGKKSNETLYLSSSDLKAAGIDNIGQVEIYFNVSDNDSYETIYKSECITIKTSDFEKMDITPDDSGNELYNADGVRIVGKYVDEDTFWGSSVLLYVENKSGKNITVQCDDLSVNGYMITNLFSSTVYAQKFAIDDITLLSSDLEKNNITSIDTIELKFEILDAETLSTIATTNPISFKTK